MDELAAQHWWISGKKKSQQNPTNQNMREKTSLQPNTFVFDTISTNFGHASHVSQQGIGEKKNTRWVRDTSAIYYKSLP